MGEWCDEAMLDVVKNKLRSENIKLWEEPFILNDGSRNQDLIDLVQRYASELQIDESRMECIIVQLQEHALGKIKANEILKKTGMAVLSLKFVSHNKDITYKEIETSLESTGDQFKASLAEMLSVPGNQFKIICMGKLLKDDKTLAAQNIRPKARLLVFEISGLKDLDMLQTLDTTKKDVSVLTQSINEESIDPVVQIEDHHGQSLNLPLEERRALTAAMMLHEKGRSAMKRQEYSAAILLFLEAEKEFGSCQDGILNSVDNFALLNLDMVWCYLNLQSLSDLPDAVRRIQVCETCFQKSYGPNMERVLALKGSSSNEETLMVRLTLLKAILSYHTNKLNQATELLKQSEDRLAALVVDEEKMSEIMVLGYSQTEARISLRAAGNNVAAAVQFLLDRQEERTKARKEREDKNKEARLRRKLGKTRNGEPINIGFYQSLILMGFSKQLSKLALRTCNNDMSEAITMLQEKPDSLLPSEPSTPRSVIQASRSQPSTSTWDTEPQAQPLNEDWDQDLSKLMEMGFDIDQARVALEKCGNVKGAIRFLLEGVCQHEEEAEEDSATSDSSDIDDDYHDQEKKLQQSEALSRFKSDIVTSDFDYLDLDLQQEKFFLAMYKSFLNIA